MATETAMVEMATVLAGMEKGVESPWDAALFVRTANVVAMYLSRNRKLCHASRVSVSSSFIRVLATLWVCINGFDLIIRIMLPM